MSMKDYLKYYEGIITVLSPIHVGNGAEIGKKEYIYQPWNHMVIIPDVAKMYMDIKRKGMEDKFIRFMTDTSPKSMPLSMWLKENGYGGEDYVKWKKYEMDAGDAFSSGKDRPKGIMTFNKDSYGMPYIPGSSIKGVLRSALLAWEIQKNPEKYKRNKNEIELKSRERANRKHCLEHEINRLEQDVLYTLNRNEKKIGNAVNDKLANLIIGDSALIALDDIILCQKIDVNLRKEEKKLPILREAVRPGTQIRFSMTVQQDESNNFYSVENIMEAVNCMETLSNRYFYEKFGRGSKEADIIRLGGGCGFVSKTVLISLCEEKTVEVVDNVFKNTLGKKYEEHKHGRDRRLGVAPHTCKCTRYNGKLYDMGMGKVEFILKE